MPGCHSIQESTYGAAAPLGPPTFGARPTATNEERRPWNALLWGIIYPRRVHRVVPTVPGVVLIALSLGIGLAAYNSSSNILFLTLSLLLTCLVLSGVLSSLNLRGVSWRLRMPSALRVGHDTSVSLEVRNAKSFLPAYGLWFNVRARPYRPWEHRAESTLTARGKDIRAALAQAEASELRGRVGLGQRLDPTGTVQLDWIFRPAERGILRVELMSVGSLFPFGFLRKDIGTAISEDVLVWPAPIEYRRFAAAAPRRDSGDECVSRAGTGNDLMALRRYTAGDSHRLIHWKASARTGQLLVRQYAAETAEGFVVWLRTDAETWSRPEQFELLVRFAASFCEDLYRAGRLLGVALNGAIPTPMRRVRDLELFLDELAVLRPGAPPTTGTPAVKGKGSLLTFAPDGTRGVAAYADGQLAASV